MALNNENKWTKWCMQQLLLSSWLRPLGVSVSSVNIQKFLPLFYPLLNFFRVDVDVTYLLNQYEFCMCVKVMVFAWKMTASRYSIWFTYIFSMVCKSNAEFSFCSLNLLYFTFGALHQVNDIFTLAI